MYIELWFNQMNALEHFDQDRSQQLPLRINPNNMVNGVSNWDQEKKFFLKTWLFWFWFCALRSFALFLIVAVLVCIASKASQVRGRAWAGRHLSRLDLLLLQRPGLIIMIKIPSEMEQHCPTNTAYTTYTASYMHLWDGWMDRSYPLRLLRLLKHCVPKSQCR